MSTKKAGWLIDYDGNQFIPMTSAFEIFNRHGARTFGYAEANDDNLGAHNKFIFIQNGVFMASTQTLAADGKTLIYLNDGSFVRSTANEGSSVNPVYLSGGTLMASSSTIGSATKPIWLNAGTITVSNGNVATDEKTLMYMSGGELLASDETEGANDKFIYLNSGTLTASTLNKGGLDTPIYFVNGVVTEGNSSSYSLGRSTESNNITIALGRGVSPAYSTISYNLGDNLIGDSTTNTITAGYQDAKFSTGLQISEGSVSEDDLYVPYARTSQYGVIKAVTGTVNFDGNLETTKAYKLYIDPTGVGYVSVPWENDYPSLATISVAGIIKIAATRSSAITATTGSTDTNRYYGVELDSNGQAFVNIPWHDYNDTYTLFVDDGSSAANISTANPYIGLWDDHNDLKGYAQFVGGDNVTIESDDNGVITISATDTKVQQTVDGSNGEYPILTRWTNEASGNSNKVGYNASCTINHSSGTLAANYFSAATNITTPILMTSNINGYGSNISVGTSLIPSGSYNLGTNTNYWYNITSQRLTLYYKNDETHVKHTSLTANYAYFYGCLTGNTTAYIYHSDNYGTIKLNGHNDYANNDIELTARTGAVTAVSFNATSDARLKENFVSFKPEKSILDLPVYKFDFINGAKNQIGCKAQDLQLICPELVVENDEGYLTIKESKIIYLLLEEVKKLKEDFQKLQKENEILKQKL